MVVTRNSRHSYCNMAEEGGLTYDLISKKKQSKNKFLGFGLDQRLVTAVK